MKAIIIIAALLAVSTSVLAAPSVVSDPTTQKVTHCGVLLDAAAKVAVPVVSDTTGKYCKYDVGTVALGQHSVKMTYINRDAVWGDTESPASAPFVFERPNAPANAPTGLGLQ